MNMTTMTGLLASAALSYAVHAAGRIDHHTAPTLYALARAKTAAVKLVDEANDGCWQRNEDPVQRMAKTLRSAGFDMVRRESHPDLLLVVTTNAARGTSSGCTTELQLALHIRTAGMSRSGTVAAGDISTVVIGSTSTRRGRGPQVDEWINSHSELFAQAVIDAWHEAKSLIGTLGYPWRITRLHHESISSPDAVRRHIRLCGNDGELWTLREGVRFVSLYFIKCMRDLTYEVRYDDQLEARDCKWLDLSAGRAGYHGELRCADDVLEGRIRHLSEARQR